MEPSLEFNLLDVYNWCFGKSVEKNDKDIPVWDSNLPKYIVPQSHPSSDFFRLCQSSYLPDQICIVNKDREVFFYMNEESLNSMLQLNLDPNVASLSIEELTQNYLELEFSSKFKVSRLFVPSKLISPNLILHLIPLIS